MIYRLNNVEIVDPTSPWNRKIKDIIIKNGKILEANSEVSSVKVIDAKGWIMMPGLCETYASIGDPGFEYREDIQSLTEAAIKGGVTSVCAIADTEPVTQHKTQIEYLVKNTKGNIVEIWPIGAITEGLKGKNPTEMFDMHQAGAVAFSDAPHSVHNSGVMMRALQYVSPFNGVIYSVPLDEDLVGEGQINEGKTSVVMGMKGISNLSESLQIYRDLSLLEYTEGNLHFTGVSTAEGVELIREAKKKGLQVTASAYLHHLLFDESEVSEFDTNFKVIPPLRTQKDVKALFKGLKDGTIDMISTQHIPLDVESKRLEFEYATPGMANIEFAFPLAMKALGDIEKVVQLMSIAPRKLFQKDIISIHEGEKANFILVDPKDKSTVKASQRKSKSSNSPYFGVELTGSVKAVFNNGQIEWND
ncbi:MAG TPA: dihydroorotase [Chitinophagales bacterium]|nr:dihydroorotase [Chitinophagales bacterium]